MNKRGKKISLRGQEQCVVALMPAIPPLPLCPPPRPSIFDLPSASTPGEIEVEGAVCGGSPSLGPSVALQACALATEGGRDVIRFIIIDNFSNYHAW
jgi:hypothetical protein